MPNCKTTQDNDEIRFDPNLSKIFDRFSLLPLLLAACLFITKPTHTFAEGRDASRLCDLAARTASDIKDVPISVLKAITRAETGQPEEHGLTPWPWTVNMEGQGKWFATEDEARSYVFRHFKRGARSFDVGCFQVNYKWHGAAFRSIDDMFDPATNAIYAAGFLRDLFEELGDWSAAAGAYHSRTPKYSRSYAERFDLILSTMTSESGFSAPNWDAPRQNSDNSIFLSSRDQAPLVGIGSTRLGSLVPIKRGSEQNALAFVVVN